MPLLKLAFRHEINIHSATSFEKDVFQDSWQEFLLQSQAYNREGKFRTPEEMIDANPKANSLHYKVGFAVGLYISGLNSHIPGIKKLIPGLVHPTFQSHHFEILHSDVLDRTQHRVVITYYTGALTLLSSFGDNLLLTTSDRSHLSPDEWADTFIIKPSGEISIWQYSPSSPLIQSNHIAGPMG